MTKTRARSVAKTCALHTHKFIKHPVAKGGLIVTTAAGLVWMGEHLLKAGMIAAVLVKSAEIGVSTAIERFID